jgi:hypothetical protein
VVFTYIIVFIGSWTAGYWRVVCRLLRQLSAPPPFHSSLESPAPLLFFPLLPRPPFHSSPDSPAPPSSTLPLSPPLPFFPLLTRPPFHSSPDSPSRPSTLPLSPPSSTLPLSPPLLYISLSAPLPLLRSLLYSPFHIWYVFTHIFGKIWL